MAAPNKPDPSFMLRHSFRIKGVENGCAVCGSPCHPDTAEIVGGRMMCGPCVRSMMHGLRECAHPNRTFSGVPFYVHATVPKP